MSASSVILLQQVHRSFGKKPILQEIDLEIFPGQIYGLLGPSGCGKTTLVKIVAGILEPASGETYVLNERMPKLSVMRQIGYMAQSDALYTSLTALENMLFFGAMYGMSTAQIKARAEEVMTLVNLAEDRHKPVQAYSGGMRRRLSLAIAILHCPPVLILDEPTVGIDPVLRKSIWQELQELARQGTAILLTTHVMDEADKCHTLAMMREGRLIAKGTSRELQERIGVSGIEEAFIYYGGNAHES
ncbi:MAG: ABC transporter ATP-binding protein [Peptococcaceae bacterium]|jgi:ABC-2 type transport system ATP-binding protein|nr:ABC transporter ATP-binding protein [Peptococcaceae bacterium]